MAHFEDNRSRNMPRRPARGSAYATTTRSQQVFRPKPPHDNRDHISLENYIYPEEHFVSPVNASGIGPASRSWFEPTDSPQPLDYSHGARSHSQFPGHPYKYHHAESDRPTLPAPGYYDQYTPSPHYHGSPNELYNSPYLYPFSSGPHHYKTPHAPSTADHTTDRVLGSSPPEGSRGYDDIIAAHSYPGPYDYSPRDYSPRDYSFRDYTSREYSYRDFTQRDHMPSSRGCTHVEHVQAPPEHIAASGSDTIFDLRNDDVLCGRGAPTNYHPGNQVFRQLVAKYQSRYLASRRSDKPEIAMKIVHIIQGRGGRFLKRTKSPGRFGWKDIGEQRAYEKACQALRENAPEIRRRLAAQELAAVSSSDSISRPGGGRATSGKSGAVSTLRL